MFHKPAHKSTAGQTVNPISQESLTHVEGPWRGPDAIRLNLRANEQIEHNGMPVKHVCHGLYEVADFRGRYVSVVADSAMRAVEQFVAAKACNYDTPYSVSEEWRAAGCPTREEWGRR